MKTPASRAPAQVVGALGVVAGVAVYVFFAYDQRERSMERSAALARIEAEQVKIRRELALQTEDLDSIRVAQGEIKARLDLILVKQGEITGRLAR